MFISNNNDVNDYYYTREHINANEATTEKLFQNVLDCAMITNDAVNTEECDIIEDLSDGSSYNSQNEDSNNSEEEKEEIENGTECEIEENQIGTKRKMTKQQLTSRKKQNT